jgi:hypothetical protein
VHHQGGETDGVKVKDFAVVVVVVPAAVAVVVTQGGEADGVKVRDFAVVGVPVVVGAAVDPVLPLLLLKKGGEKRVGEKRREKRIDGREERREDRREERRSARVDTPFARSRKE